MIRNIVALIVVLAAIATLVTLGAWQVERLQWKEALIAKATAIDIENPQALPGPSTWSKLDLEEWRYRPIELTGHLDKNAELHFYIGLTKSKGPLNGPGYFVLSPLEIDTGHIIFVNRGFVPEKQKAKERRAETSSAQKKSYIGLFIPGEKQNIVSLADDLQKNIWLTKDTNRMATALNLDPEKTAPFIIDLVKQHTPEGGVPQAGETHLSFKNNHLGYAITWFGLGLALLIISSLVLIKRMRTDKNNATN